MILKYYVHSAGRTSLRIRQEFCSSSMRPFIRVREILTERSENRVNPQVFLHHINHILLRIVQYIVKIAASMVRSKIWNGVDEVLGPFESEEARIGTALERESDRISAVCCFYRLAMDVCTRGSYYLYGLTRHLLFRCWGFFDGWPPCRASSTSLIRIAQQCTGYRVDIPNSAADGRHLS